MWPAWATEAQLGVPLGSGQSARPGGSPQLPDWVWPTNPPSGPAAGPDGGQAGSRSSAGRIRSGESSWASPRSQESQHLWSAGAGRNQHGTCTVATGGWLAGRCETPSAACPFGSHWSGLTHGSRCLPLANGRLRGVWSVFSAPSQPWPFPKVPSVKSACLWFTAMSRVPARAAALPVLSSSWAGAASPSKRCG